MVVAHLRDTPAPVVVVIPDGPRVPAEEDCLGFLSRVVARLDEVAAEASDDGVDPYDDPWPDGPAPATSVLRLGVVIHRLGSPTVCDIDRVWMRALGLVCVALGMDIIGVLTRIRSGSIVRVPESAAA